MRSGPRVEEVLVLVLVPGELNVRTAITLSPQNPDFALSAGTSKLSCINVPIAERIWPQTPNSAPGAVILQMKNLVRCSVQIAGLKIFLALLFAINAGKSWDKWALQ